MPRRIKGNRTARPILVFFTRVGAPFHATTSGLRGLTAGCWHAGACSLRCKQLGLLVGKKKRKSFVVKSSDGGEREREREGHGAWRGLENEASQRENKAEKRGRDAMCCTPEPLRKGGRRRRRRRRRWRRWRRWRKEGGMMGRESVPLHAHYHLFIWKTSLHRSRAG